jgi:hypothetical protein
MANTLIRSNRQLLDGSVTYVKLASNFLQSTTWAVSSDNSSTITGLQDPTNANDAVNKNYVDGLVDTTFKAPDGFATNANGDYPSDYKGSGSVDEGDSFYVTDVTNGTAVGNETVNVGDLLVALSDSPGNTDSNWLIMESNRDYATDAVPGVVELATQTEASAGTDTTRAITPATLDGYIDDNGIEKGAGQGLSEDASYNFNVGATDASIVVGADDIGVGVGNTNGTSLEITATGVELAAGITGARSFSGGAFSVDSGSGTVSIKSGGTLTLDATADNTVLTAQPTGGTDLAVATTKYVDDQIDDLPTEIYNELPSVTDGSANVTLANTPTSGTERVYLNGVRQAPGSSNDYTISGTTVTFSAALSTGDVVLVDYKY